MFYLSSLPLRCGMICNSQKWLLTSVYRPNKCRCTLYLGYSYHQFHCNRPPQYSNWNRQYSVKAANFYDILELTPTATRAQIKTAYFRMSKIYHPDKNNSVDAVQMFAMISEAYEVLGNPRTRTLYDQNIMSQRSSGGVDIKDPAYEDFLHQRGKFSRKGPAPTGKTKIYDFDEFYRQHYGETLKKTAKARKHHDDYERKRAEMKMHSHKWMALYTTYALIALAVVVSRLKRFF